MKLAELLNERKAVKEEIKKIKDRLSLAVKMQEGDEKPVEAPDELKNKLVELYARHGDLIVKINRANMDMKIDGKTLMQLIAERDQHIAIAGTLHDIAKEATPKHSMFSRNEIRFVPTIDIKRIHREADNYAKIARETDNKIQAANWNTEVL
ncbi:MAG: DIP1984 family protein [Nitrospirae bacterium]|nr:DIP1984 family protein [Nitrospirota bacterium]